MVLIGVILFPYIMLYMTMLACMPMITHYTPQEFKPSVVFSSTLFYYFIMYIPLQFDRIKSPVLRQVFSEKNLLKATIACGKNVAWKTQKKQFFYNLLSRVNNLKYKITSDSYTPAKKRVIPVYEPKRRNVLSTQFMHRIPIRALLDEYFAPRIEKSFIYDNFACQKGKGTDRARDRLIKHLSDARSQQGEDNIWVLQSDIKSYYESISFDNALNIFKKYSNDRGAIGFIKKELQNEYDANGHFIPGSQLIQVVGLAMLDPMDHYIKENLHTRFYIRYMDDFILIGKSKEELEEKLNLISEHLAQYGLRVHPTKTKIIKFTRRTKITFLGFDFKYSGNSIKKFINQAKFRQSLRVVRRIAKSFASRHRPFNSDPVTYERLVSVLRDRILYLRKGASEPMYRSFYRNTISIVTRYCVEYGIRSNKCIQNIKKDLRKYKSHTKRIPGPKNRRNSRNKQKL